MKRYHRAFDTRTLNCEQTDVLVVGSGLAGLAAAVEAAKTQGVQVLLISRGKLIDNSSSQAQGGIACAMPPGDSWKEHARDTVRAGRGLVSSTAARALAKEGLKHVRALIKQGLKFDQRKGRLLFGMEAAHSRARILHAHGDQTGAVVQRFLLAQAKNAPNIRFGRGHELQEIITRKGRFSAALVESKNRLKVVQANALVLATGGYSNLFGFSSNPLGGGGDAIGVAHRAGCTLQDLEFEQFHPTVFKQRDGTLFLVSEAVRGEGATLTNEKGEDIMENVLGGALAGRDIVTARLFARQRCGKQTWLDARMFEKGFFKKRFPTIYSKLKKSGVNPEHHLIPVQPAAHYSIGGIKTDLHGRTNVKGVYAVGECSCTGVHGANRLASNSLLETLVFGVRAGARAGKEKEKPFIHATTQGQARKKENPAALLKAWRRLQGSMWLHAGIVRSARGLRAAQKAALACYTRAVQTQGPKSAVLADRALMAHALSKSALLRRESRGCHVRTDYPEKSARWKKHSVVKGKKR